MNLRKGSSVKHLLRATFPAAMNTRANRGAVKTMLHLHQLHPTEHKQVFGALKPSNTHTNMCIHFTHTLHLQMKSVQLAAYGRQLSAKSLLE